jgi:hypothetical protein
MSRQLNNFERAGFKEFNETLENSFNLPRVIRFFTDELSGSECAIILRNREEICVTADEAWDIEAQAQARHDEYTLMCEIG